MIICSYDHVIVYRPPPPCNSFTRFCCLSFQLPPQKLWRVTDHHNKRRDRRSRCFGEAHEHVITSRYATENSYRYVLRPIKCSRINTFLCIEVPAGGSDFYHTGIFDREVSPRSGRSVVIGRAGGNKNLEG